MLDWVAQLPLVLWTRAMKKPGGTVDKAHAWIRPSNMFMIDMIDMVTEPLHVLYFHWASKVKSVSDGLQFNISRAKQGMRDQLLSIAKASLIDQVALNNLISADDVLCNSSGI